MYCAANCSSIFDARGIEQVAEKPDDAMMTQTRPTELHQRRILMTRRPAAAAEARSQVRGVIRGWEVPVDPDIAVLLTSDRVGFLPDLHRQGHVFRARVRA